MSRSVRGWVATLTGAAAAGLWSFHEGLHDPARTAVAVLAGISMGVCLQQFIKLARDPEP